MILSVVTYDSTTIHNVIAVNEAFETIGYTPDKIMYLINRADSAGGISREEMIRSLGRKPEFEVVSDGRLVVQANNEGMPFVVSAPEAAISRDIKRTAAAILGMSVAVPVGR